MFGVFGFSLLDLVKFVMTHILKSVCMSVGFFLIASYRVTKLKV